MALKLDTPCIGVCSTVYGDKVCRGCKRHYDEVINWLAYNTDDKKRVYDRLNDHMVEIVGRYLSVEDPALLKTMLDRYSIRYRDDQDPLTWALHFLMFGSNKCAHAAELGLKIHPPHDTVPLDQLCNIIDKQLYQYSMEQY